MVELSQDELELFVTEAEENIANLENGLLKLEREGDAALVAELFRYAHTQRFSRGSRFDGNESTCPCYGEPT